MIITFLLELLWEYKSDILRLMVYFFGSCIVFIAQFLSILIICVVFVLGLIKQVVQHHGQVIYTRTTKGDDPVA